MIPMEFCEIIKIFYRYWAQRVIFRLFCGKSCKEIFIKMLCPLVKSFLERLEDCNGRFYLLKLDPPSNHNQQFISFPRISQITK